jgi:ABC-type multidrug transport system fused ATPase/permease subunit
MDNFNPQPRKVLMPIIWFVTTIVIALILLVVALVVWVAELVHSGSVAALIVGGVFMLISLIIYLITARKSIEYLHNHLETIYDVAYAARRGYRTTIILLKSLFRI